MWVTSIHAAVQHLFRTNIMIQMIWNKNVYLLKHISIRANAFQWSSLVVLNCGRVFVQSTAFLSSCPVSVWAILSDFQSLLAASDEAVRSLLTQWGEGPLICRAIPSLIFRNMPGSSCLILSTKAHSQIFLIWKDDFLWKEMSELFG